jgi:hypothetical protein
MLDRLRWCDERLRVLAEVIEAHDEALRGVLADLRAGREPPGDDLAALVVVADRRAEAGQEYLGLVRERGALRLGLVAAQNPFRAGGIAGRARSIRLARAQAEGDVVSAGAWAKELRGEALLIDRARLGQGRLDDTTVPPVRLPAAQSPARHRQ